MIKNTNLIYSAQFDLYVDQTTMVIYKRNNRHRKTEIDDSELIPLPLICSHNKYIRFRDYKTGSAVCISYVFADVFPERVGNHELHLLDPETFSELDHVDHVHDTYESNFPERMRWTSATVNRADTSRTKYTKADIDEKTAKRLKRKREKYAEMKQDPEQLAKNRAKWAAYKRRKYAEIKDHRKEWNDAVNEEMLRRIDKQ